MCGKWEEIICDEINDGVIDGAALLICDSKHFFPKYAGGEITDGMVMSCDRIIDIASVSKAVMTVMELLFCRSRGMVGFDAPFPGCSVTVRDLALHISGFCQKKQLKCLYLAEEDRGEQLRNSLHFPAAKTHRVYLLELSVARTDRRRNHGAVFDEVLSHATFRVAWCDGFIARAAWDHRFRSAHTNLWNEGTGRARGFRRFPHLSRRWLRGEIPGCFHDTEPREFPLDFVLWRPTACGKKFFPRTLLCEPTVNAMLPHPPVQCSFGWGKKDAHRPESVSVQIIYHSEGCGRTLCLHRFRAPISCGDADDVSL